MKLKAAAICQDEEPKHNVFDFKHFDTSFPGDIEKYKALNNRN